MHRDARGKGLMTEALELGIEWAYETRGLARFSLTTHPDNVASQRVAEKAGFHQVGATVPHDEVFRDGTTTAILFHRDLR
jgi:RimJ/RimL family protein N-acetyltransferase